VAQAKNSATLKLSINSY